MPKIRIDLYIVSESLVFADVSNILGIEAIQTRRKEDFPLPEFSCTHWGLRTGKDESLSVDQQFRKFYYYRYRI